MNNENKPTPHPHAELIKAWADGAEIQHFDTSAMQWKDCKEPNWFIQSQYRIKPESDEPWKPKGGYRYFHINSGGLVRSDSWGDLEIDRVRYKFGNCFRNKEEAEAAIPRVEVALRGTTDVSANVGSNVGSPTIDGKSLTDGEIALIKALRKKKINKVFNESSSVLAAIIDDGHGGVVGTVRKYVAIVPSDDLQPISIISALEQIKAEQEARNEA